MTVKHAEATIMVAPNVNSRPTRNRSMEGTIAMEAEAEQEAGEYVIDVSNEEELQEALTALANEDMETLKQYLKPKEE